jgi:hypothetical protein
MNNWCICWFFTHVFTGILIFKGLTARRLCKSFGVKGLNRANLNASLCLSECGESNCGQKLPVVKVNWLTGREQRISTTLNETERRVVLFSLCLALRFLECVTPEPFLRNWWAINFGCGGGIYESTGMP